MPRLTILCLALIATAAGQFIPIADYSRIEAGLWLGGSVDRPPPGTEAVLNVCTIKDRYKARFHAHHPIKDSPPAPSLDWLRDAVKWVETQRKAGRTTFIHCQAGVSRAAMVTAAYLMHDRGWGRDRALKYIREKRPKVAPNPAFLELLAEYERHLSRERRR
jgi:hypothetical protein